MKDSCSVVHVERGGGKMTSVVGADNVAKRWERLCHRRRALKRVCGHPVHTHTLRLVQQQEPHEQQEESQEKRLHGK